MTGVAQPVAGVADAETSLRPAVSLCVPAYQAERHLRATFESLLAQTHSDFEIVVIDNNSSDGTAAVLESFSDSRIRVIRNESTLPLVDNFNHAVRQCRGEFVKLVCADDLLHPDCIAAQSAVLERYRGVALVGAQTDFVDDAGSVLRSRRGLGNIVGRHPAHHVVRTIVRSGTNPIGAPLAVMFRRSDFLRSGGFRDRWLFLSDVDLWVRLLQYGEFYGVPGRWRPSGSAVRPSRPPWPPALSLRSTAPSCARSALSTAGASPAPTARWPTSGCATSSCAAPCCSPSASTETPVDDPRQ